MRLAILVLSILVVACDSGPSDKGPQNRSASGLDKFEDPENGVVCYRYYRETLSCVKVN